MIDEEGFMRIYNMLPLIDCGECGAKTCKEFAEKIIIGEKGVFECSKIENEIAQEISLILDEYLR